MMSLRAHIEKRHKYFKLAGGKKPELGREAVASMRRCCASSYWSRDNWRTSQKGNSFVVIDERGVTWFQKRDGWSCRARR